MLDKRRPVHFPRSLTMLVMVKAVKQRHIPNPNPNPSAILTWLRSSTKPGSTSLDLNPYKTLHLTRTLPQSHPLPRHTHTVSTAGLQWPTEDLAFPSRRRSLV